jgi:hypothetical protein
MTDAVGRDNTFDHGRMARGNHGLPKVSLGLAIPDPYMLCGQATPETALRPFLGRPIGRVTCGRHLLL